MQRNGVKLQISGESARNNHFEQVRRGFPGTAATRIPLVVTFDHIMNGMGPQNRHHDFFSLYLVKRGRGVHLIDGTRYGIARGDVYAMNAGMTHWFDECDGLETDTLHFSPALFDDDSREALLETPGFLALFLEGEEAETSRHRLHLTPDAYAPISADIEELRNEWRSGTAAGAAIAKALFIRLVIQLARLSSTSSELAPRIPTRAFSATHSAHGATVAAALRYLDAHFHEPVRIERLAASVFLSADRFTEVFREEIGRTPRDYLRHLRLECARTLLLSSDLPVGEVAVQSGFGEAAYFTRAFRASEGMTPSEFRLRR